MLNVEPCNGEGMFHKTLEMTMKQNTYSVHYSHHIPAKKCEKKLGA